MATAIPVEATSYAFDDRNIRWYKLGDFENFVFAMFNVDVPGKIVDFILKFPANQQIFLHRHLALTNTLVVRGSIVCTSRMAHSRRCGPWGVILPVLRVSRIGKETAMTAAM